MTDLPPFDACVAARLDRLSPAETHVVRFFQENREEVLVASASALAAKIGTSDATVIRATKALGYSGLDHLRRQLAGELRQSLSPAARLTRTLGDVGDDLPSAFAATLDVHIHALEKLRRDITPDMFEAAVKHATGAKRVLVFGIGPSSSMADYLVFQLDRFGIDSISLTATGLLFADELHRLRKGDLMVIMAYGRTYRELAVLLDQADHLGIAKILVTDTLGFVLRKRVDLVLPVARGKVDALSMHTATLGLIEALLVGVAARRPAQTIASLERLNELRAKLAGPAMDLPTPDRGPSPSPSRKERGVRREPSRPKTN
jgi:DNA-binding MurR/RpiR family transcriptional regulator